MEVNITGLKCDNCDYRDDEVQFSEYKESIGKPCPRCGESLLTEEDYQQCVRYYKVVDAINKIEDVLKWLNPLHYWRLVFGDKREAVTATIKYRIKKK